MKLQWIVLFTAILHSNSIIAEEAKPTFEYPELLVTPKASEQLMREAKDEPSKSWTSHIPVQSSALLTLYASVTAMSDKSDDHDKESAANKDKKTEGAAQIGTLVGGGWLTTTVLMSALYRPYKTCRDALPKAPSTKDKEATLTRERAAEECLDAPARLARRINLLSIVSNLVANSYIAAVAQEDMTKSIAGLAAVGSFAPLLFSYHWQDVAEYHEDYKKRIYGPLTSLGLVNPYNTQKLTPALTLAYQF